MKTNKTPIFPIPPAFHKGGSIDYESIKKYLDYLERNGVECIMTTAGSSQFNLLSVDEVFELGVFCARNFKNNSIIGVPALSFKCAKKFVKKLNQIENLKNSSIMLLYPDRYYNDKDIIEYFYGLANESKLSVYIHGMFMRSSIGDLYNFTSRLINKIASHDNIIGIKEETSVLSEAYNICKNVKKENPNFEIIVAGGSQRRFLFLKTAGVDNFLSGIGSIWPKADIDFFKLINEGNYSKAQKITENYENPFFDIFMKHGWHLSFNTGLQEIEIYKQERRKPFPLANEKTRMEIQEILKNTKYV